MQYWLLPDEIEKYVLTLHPEKDPDLVALAKANHTRYGSELMHFEVPRFNKFWTKENMISLENLMISPDVGQLLQFLIKLINAKHCLEVGTWTGYGTLCMAKALPADGKVVTCDINPEPTEIAKEYWQKAGMNEKVELYLEPALAAMERFIHEGRHFDLIFIDADKRNYANYVEKSLALLTKNGLILVDNALYLGKILDETLNDPDTVAIRSFNEKVTKDERLDVLLLTISDGVMLIRKKSLAPASPGWVAQPG